jgi:hypothetical protein
MGLVSRQAVIVGVAAEVVGEARGADDAEAVVDVSEGADDIASVDNPTRADEARGVDDAGSVAGPEGVDEARGADNAESVDDPEGVDETERAEEAGVDVYNATAEVVVTSCGSAVAKAKQPRRAAERRIAGIRAAFSLLIAIAGEYCCFLLGRGL